MISDKERVNLFIVSLFQLYFLNKFKEHYTKEKVILSDH